MEQEEVGRNDIESFGTNLLNHEGQFYPTTTRASLLNMDNYNSTPNSTNMTENSSEFDKFYFYQVSVNNQFE